MMFGASSGGYPWDSDPRITHAWVMDSKFVIRTGPNVTSVLPQKGNIPLIVDSPGFPQFVSGGYGSASKDHVTFNGVDELLSGDAVAPLVSGTAAPFTFLFSGQCLDASPHVRGVLGFATALTSNSNMDFWQNQSSNGVTGTAQWGLRRLPSSGPPGLLALTSSVVDVTQRVVISNIYSGSAVVRRFNAAAIGSFSYSTGAMVPTQFSVGGLRSGGGASYIQMKLRTLLFAASALPSSSYLPAESFLVAEAA